VSPPIEAQQVLSDLDTASPTFVRSKRFAPSQLETLADTGLTRSLIEQLILKLLYFKGDLVGRQLAHGIGLRFSLIEDLVEMLKSRQMLQVKGSGGLGPVSCLLSLTEMGRGVTRDYLGNNQYVGPAPVPIAQYAAAVTTQKLPNSWLSFERLAEAFEHLVMSEQTLDQIGPAVGSGKSFLIYGHPGNGKTSIAEALANLQTSPIWIPFALEYQGNIVQLFDPIYHRPLEDSASVLNAEDISDGRWMRCKRPFIASGGELSLSMLDLSYNSVSKIYDAPLQLKANNGIYLVDDFGRQKVTPAEILNRWIVPMEQHIDYLTFWQGGKTSVPFEAFLIFSTNLTPDQLGDEAFLRRIQYKLLVRSPEIAEFRTIFVKQCGKHNLSPPQALIDGFIQKHYTRPGRKFRRCHPRDLLSLATDHIAFKRMPNELTEELLDHAFECCFINTKDLIDA
jgi:predicted ATPase with chaperone activity